MSKVIPLGLPRSGTRRIETPEPGRIARAFDSTWRAWFTLWCIAGFAAGFATTALGLLSPLILLVLAIAGTFG